VKYRRGGRVEARRGNDDRRRPSSMGVREKDLFTQVNQATIKGIKETYWRAKHFWRGQPKRLAGLFKYLSLVWDNSGKELKRGELSWGLRVSAPQDVPPGLWQDTKP